VTLGWIVQLLSYIEAVCCNRLLRGNARKHNVLYVDVRSW